MELTCSTDRAPVRVAARRQLQVGGHTVCANEFRRVVRADAGHWVALMVTTRSVVDVEVR